MLRSTKRSKKFEIDGFTIHANPDCTIVLSVKDNEKKRVRDVHLHMEV